MLKKLGILGGTVIIITGILVAACYQNYRVGSQGYDIECVQSSQPTSTSASLTCKIYQSQDTKHGHSSARWWDILITWPEGITAWLLLLTLAAIVWQSWATHNSAKATQVAANAALAQIELVKAKERCELALQPDDFGDAHFSAFHHFFHVVRLEVTRTGLDGAIAFPIVSVAKWRKCQRPEHNEAN